jgi:hypothetical protein
MKAGVTRLGKVIDPQTRTFTLEVEMKNAGERLKPNMLTSVRIQDYRNEQAMVVPSFILRQDFNGTFLFKAMEENGVSRARKILCKARDHGTGPDTDHGRTLLGRSGGDQGLQPGIRRNPSQNCTTLASPSWRQKRYNGSLSSPPQR